MEDEQNKINETENLDNLINEVNTEQKNKIGEEKKEVNSNEKNKTDNVFTQSNGEFNEPQKRNKSFIIKYIIFVIILVLITAGACYYTIVYKNKDKQIKASKQIIEEITKEKRQAEDSIYAVNSYTETYNENPITIEYLYYENGEINTKKPEGNSNQFIKISGLKDKRVEEKINKRFIDTVEEWKDIGESSYVFVSGNFSNVLSCEMYYYIPESNKNQTKTFNIDLNTGDDIPFEKVFVSSAPIKSMLVENLYENLSWVNKKQDDTSETWEDSYNMDKVDTSDYEDKALLLARKYDKKKDNIKYLISPTSVTIYNLLDNDIIDEKFYYQTLNIELYKYKDEVAIYKRYLNNKSIYEDDSKGLKNIIVFTSLDYIEQYDITNYGKISDNVFLEEVKGKDENKNDITENFIAKKLKEFNEKIINETSKDKGIICQRICESNNYYDYKYKKYTDEYFVVSFETHIATCSSNYFKEYAFKDYIKMKSAPSAGIELKSFSNEDWTERKQFPNLTIKDEYERYYLDRDGNIVATSYEEMDKFIEQKFMEEQQQNQPDVPENVEQNEDSSIENSNEDTQLFIGDYINESITDTYYYSAKLIIITSTDTYIEFDLSAAAGIDVDHVNIGQVSGTAKKIAEGIYRFEETIDGKTYEITFTVVGNNIVITEEYPDNYNPYAGHNVYFAGEYLTK